MKVLIIDDDFTSRKLLSKMLSIYGECDIAVNGKEAVKAFEEALKNNEPYNLLCLDIMMPEMDGHQTLKKIRTIEKHNNIQGLDGVKIIMITALGDMENVTHAFREQCEGYLVKPINKEKLEKKLNEFGFI